ncbi:hypothetical protein SAMN05216201_10920 [Pseudomonas linyingensis]|uniref:Uncharacterized protein n=1 Tax=Pseudomonas linyingensis TaxID=915471 RepID=A0A1H6Z8R0_9PSED|nr:hypothetical protein [Pseudomonas linyingensis]SEJ45275.1 hypothetical protein SAMN05216201_10920 [Pseudomonas linyingensis]
MLERWRFVLALTWLVAAWLGDAQAGEVMDSVKARGAFWLTR